MPADSFFRPVDSGFEATGATAGPWSPDAQHGSPPAALLASAIEELGEGFVGRFAMDLLGPVPVARVGLAAEVLRPGRNVALRQATLTDEGGRALARAQAWVFPRHDGGPGKVGPAPAHAPADGHPQDPPASWSTGYLDAVEWRWITGSVSEPGPAVVWMRPRVPLLPGVELTPLQRLLSCVDSASGVSAALDPAEWNFLNTELTVHVVREPVGEWVCLDARTTLGPGSVGLATSDVYDEEGLVAHSAQALLVVPAQR